MIDEDPISLALRIRDPVLADRLTELLSAVPGLRLAAADELPDVILAEGDVQRAHHVTDGVDAAGLTPREREVLTLLTEGASNRVIAQRLGISVHTAKFHVGRVIDKLDATGRTDAVAHAARTGVIHL